MVLRDGACGAAAECGCSNEDYIMLGVLWFRLKWRRVTQRMKYGFAGGKSRLRLGWLRWAGVWLNLDGDLLGNKLWTAAA